MPKAGILISLLDSAAGLAAGGDRKLSSITYYFIGLIIYSRLTHLLKVNLKKRKLVNAKS